MPLNENMASCVASDANESDCPRSRGEALAFFLSRSQNNSAAELRPSTAHANRKQRESRITQHIQLFEGRTVDVSARPSESTMSASLMATSSREVPEVLREPVYVNVTTGPGAPRSTVDLPTAPRKKPVPNPRKSLAFAPIAEGGNGALVVLDSNAQNMGSSPVRRAPALPPSLLLESVNPVQAIQVDLPRAASRRDPQTDKRRNTLGDFGLPTFSIPPPLPETNPPVRRLTNSTASSPRPENSSRIASGSTTSLNPARTPVKDVDFIRHLTELTNNQRKCLTLPTGTARPVFGPQSPSPSLIGPPNISPSDETVHPSRRPLPKTPVPSQPAASTTSATSAKKEDEPYSDTAGEPIYQELSEVSSVYSGKSARLTPLVRQDAVRRIRRDAGHFRSLRGLPAEFGGGRKPRAASFTTADLVGGVMPVAGAGRSRNGMHPHSSSCSSMSLTESDSGVSLELESMRDDSSVRGIQGGVHWDSAVEFQKAVEKMKGFQCRSESLNNNDARIKSAPKMLHDKTRRHTLPVSMQSATVLDDDENDSGDNSPEKMIAEIAGFYPARGLWYQQPGVQQTAILSHLSDDQRKFQEAVFEIICSEATHLRSLTVLIGVFKNAPEFSTATKIAQPAEVSPAVVSQQEERNLFLNILDVRNTSCSLLHDLHERCLQHYEEVGMPTMPDFSGILEHFAVNQAKVYVKYCSDQLFQEKTLNGLKERKRFQEVVRRLESQPICQQLDFRSYLMLPMQRITRLPLLISSVVKRCEIGSSEYIGYNNALLAINKVVRECDEGAKRANCIEELCRIDAILQWNFDASLKKIPIISAARSLVKRGAVDVIQIEHKFLPRRTFHKKSMHLLVFNDLFMLTKRKSGSEEALVVVDYCQRNLVDCLQVTPAERDDLLAHTSISAVFAKAEAFRGVKLVLLRNNAQKTVEFFLVMTLESDYMRWMSVLNPSEKVEGDEKIYEIWDCPQYEVFADYTANENDELSVAVGDVVDVYRKSSDGWIEGRRMTDGHRGWLPTSVAKELMTEHARARHLKERNRLLAASAQIMQERIQK